MPRKTGEDQLLLLTVPWLQQGKHESSLAAPWWTEYALRAPVHAQQQQPEEGWLCKADQRARRC